MGLKHERNADLDRSLEAIAHQVQDHNPLIDCHLQNSSKIPYKRTVLSENGICLNPVFDLVVPEGEDEDLNTHTLPTCDEITAIVLDGIEARLRP